MAAKANVSANAWLNEGLNCWEADNRIVGADARILNADGNLLGAGVGFLFAVMDFLSSFKSLLSAVRRCLGAGVCFLKAEGSFQVADENSLRDVAYFLK